MTIAAIALFDRVIKRDLADNIQLIPLFRACLAHKSVGVRVAACQCIRALSRDAAIIRTNLTDSGAGLALYQVFKKEDEDPRVIFAALAVVCNLVNDFSPLRPVSTTLRTRESPLRRTIDKVMLSDGLLPRLMRLSRNEDQEIRMGALWALKNLLCKSSLATKQMVMTHLRWTHLAECVFWLLAWRVLLDRSPLFDFIFETDSSTMPIPRSKNRHFVFSETSPRTKKASFLFLTRWGRTSLHPASPPVSTVPANW